MSFDVLSQLIIEHLYIVLLATAIGVAVGVVLAVLGYWYAPIGKVVLAFSDVVQTVPALALLAILMVWFGMGDPTMILGLVLYSLLPIVRNTHTGLTEIPSHIKNAAKGMGMTRLQRLYLVELPLARPLIFTGIKIALVTSLGTAVLGVFIGAGGLGDPVYRGFQTDNISLMLSGAIPVIIMAVGFDFIMGYFEKKMMKSAKIK